jgi:hypothetical protein
MTRNGKKWKSRCHQFYRRKISSLVTVNGAHFFHKRFLALPTQRQLYRTLLILNIWKKGPEAQRIELNLGPENVILFFQHLLPLESSLLCSFVREHTQTRL